MSPFFKRIDPGYKTVETIYYSTNYVYASIAGASPLTIEYRVTAVVSNRKEFMSL